MRPAENHPSADYPDEEEVDDLDDEDAWLSSIRRRQRGGDVFDEDEYGYGYDDDEIYHSDDENDDDGLAGFRKWQAARRARGY